MQIGFNMLLWTGHVQPEHWSIIEDIKKTGYDGIEVPIFEGTPDHFSKLGRELDSLGLKRTGLAIFPTVEVNPIGADPRARASALRHIMWAIECCAAMGAPQLSGPIHSTLGYFSGAAPTADERRNGAEFHRAAGDMAKKNGVKLIVEALNRFECYFLTTIADLATYLDTVDHPNVSGMYDTFHANIEEKDPIEAIKTLGRHLSHVHISENDRGTPGRGHIDMNGTFKALKASGYDGWLTIEAFGRALPQLAAATRVWRDFFPDPSQVYREGYQVIRDGWKSA